MHTKTMEGLVGAGTNMNLLNTPFRVYKEARQKGDLGTMKRAMGYVGEFSQKAEEYQKKAVEGMNEEAKEAKEKAKTELESAIQKRREEREEFDKQLEEQRDQNLGYVNLDSGASEKTTANPSKTEPVIYSKSGEVTAAEPGVNISVSI